LRFFDGDFAHRRTIQEISGIADLEWRRLSAPDHSSRKIHGWIEILPFDAADAGSR
jgi:hypothetical protein